MIQRVLRKTIIWTRLNNIITNKLKYTLDERATNAPVGSVVQLTDHHHIRFRNVHILWVHIPSHLYIRCYHCYVSHFDFNPFALL